MMTKEEIIECFGDSPKKKLVTDDLVDAINKMNEDPDIHTGAFSELFIDFTTILTGSRFSLEQYFCAVKYASYRLANVPQQEAYEKTFPELKARRDKNGAALSTYQSSAFHYHQTKLVQQILTQTAIPMRLMYDRVKHDMVNILISKATDPAAGHRVNMESADKLLTHLKDPDEKHFTLHHEMKDDDIDAIAQLRSAADVLNASQKQSIMGGASIKQIAESRIIDVETIDDE